MSHHVISPLHIYILNFIRFQTMSHLQSAWCDNKILNVKLLKAKKESYLFWHMLKPAH